MVGSGADDRLGHTSGHGAKGRSQTLLRSAEIVGRRPRHFEIVPDAEMLAMLAQRLGLLALAEVRFVGELCPDGGSDLRLDARLDALATQACVVTLAPVETPIAAAVERLYLADMSEPEEAEFEMPEDDSREALPQVIDLVEVMAEAIALALPDYPRSAGASLGEAVFAPPGVAPLRAADLNPFAALSALRPGDGAPPPDGDESET